MKLLTLAPVLLVTAAFAAQTAVTFKPKVGQKATYSLDAKMDVAGMDAVITSNVEVEVKKSDDKVIGVASKWPDLKVEVNGNPAGVEAIDGDVELNANFEPIKIAGGIEGSDQAQWFIAAHFIPPVGKELTAGLKYKVEVKEVKDLVPAYTYDGEYVGKEDLNGKPAYKFKAKVAVKGTEALTSDLTVHVREDGTMVKTVADFKNMDIPAVGQKANGKVTLTLKS